MLESKAWPFIEAKALLTKLNGKLPAKGFVLFETGYGPSGLPHIGTFGEVVRTTMVRNAFEKISGMPTKLFCVSDDMDGMRKIPDTIPNPEEYKKYLDLPLSNIPDPFDTHESFGHHMNARLRSFLDTFAFDYEFKSATECYKSGVFNEMLLSVLKNYDEIMAIMLPTLGDERQKTYSPFLPICKRTGKVLQVPIVSKNLVNSTISYLDDKTNEIVETSVINGHCKLQWKPDFGMRWAAFDVDFEMYGKDHLVNGKIYSAICKVLHGTAPQQMFYELFLDQNGQKISKSKGNGLTIDEWLRYAPQESLTLFMYLTPQKAKKLYFEMIPKCVDEYITHIQNFHKEVDESKKTVNPAYHIHNGNPPQITTQISYSLLLNLVSACNTENENVIWQYIDNFYGKNHKQNHDNKEYTDNLDSKEKQDHVQNSIYFLKNIVRGAMAYYHDFIKPHKKYRLPNEQERNAIQDLKVTLIELQASNNSTSIDYIKNNSIISSEIIQNKVYEIGTKYNIELRNWFSALYEILLGSTSGPRFGSFIALYGIDNTVQLIDDSLKEINSLKKIN